MLVSSILTPPSAMDGFDPITMAYLNPGVPMDQSLPQNLAAPDLVMPLDTLSNYDNETFVGSEDASQYGLTFQPPLTPSFKRFSSTYDDGLSDHLSQYDQHVQHEQVTGDASIDRDHKLLSFSLPTLSCNVLDYACRPAPVNMSAQLHGMFFLAESPWPAVSGEVAPLTELTCYRRNLFQVTGNVTLPRTTRYVMNEHGEQLPIASQELVISATESVEQNSVKIISVPWKTPASGAPASTEDKAEKEPTTVALDLMNGQDIDGDYISLPFAWKRLQFRIATANNGRRKELQQHFVVHLQVIATLEDGSKVPLCEIHSGPIIVRGRSPRNFQSRNDLPIGTSSGGGRRSLHTNHGNGSNSSLPSQPVRTPSGDSVNIKLEPPRSAPIDITKMHIPSPYEASIDMGQLSPAFFDWQMPQANLGAIGATQVPSAYPLGPLDPSPPHSTMYAQSTPDLSRTAMFNSHQASGQSHHGRHHSHQNISFQPFANIPQLQPPPSKSSRTRAPISLSLTDDSDTKPTIQSTPARASMSPFADSQPPPRKVARLSATPTISSALLSPSQASATPAESRTTPAPQGSPRKSPPANPNFTVPVSGTNFDADSADLLYEYFPLGLDDWMPPVDAVYRPHVVHHTNLPADPKSLGGFSSGFAVGGTGLAGLSGISSRLDADGSPAARRTSKRYLSEEGISA